VPDARRVPGVDELSVRAPGGHVQHLLTRQAVLGVIQRAAGDAAAEQRADLMGLHRHVGPLRNRRRLRPLEPPTDDDLAPYPPRQPQAVLAPGVLTNRVDGRVVHVLHGRRAPQLGGEVGKRFRPLVRDGRGDGGECRGQPGPLRGECCRTSLVLLPSLGGEGRKPGPAPLARRGGRGAGIEVQRLLRVSLQEAEAALPGLGVPHKHHAQRQPAGLGRHDERRARGVESVGRIALASPGRDARVGRIGLQRAHVAPVQLARRIPKRVAVPCSRVQHYARRRPKRALTRLAQDLGADQQALVRADEVDLEHAAALSLQHGLHPHSHGVRALGQGPRGSEALGREDVVS